MEKERDRDTEYERGNDPDSIQHYIKMGKEITIPKPLEADLLRWKTTIKKDGPTEQRAAMQTHRDLYTGYGPEWLLDSPSFTLLLMAAP